MNCVIRPSRSPSVRSIRSALAEHPCPDADHRARMIRGAVDHWRSQRGPFSTRFLLAVCCDEMNGAGVEHIPGGRSAHSPAIDYVDMGHSYAMTVCVLTYRDGRQTVALCPWGVIVEWGSYE